MDIGIERIEAIVLEAMRAANAARTPDAQMAIARDAVIFGPGSPLDSLGLVALIIDIEEAFARHGVSVTLSDERSMSQTRSPFATVPALVAYIRSIATAQG